MQAKADCELVPFAEGLWIAEGGEVEVFGFRYPTRMVVMRLEGGGLFLWSPVEGHERWRAALSALGRVDHIVAPNSLHHLALAEWHTAYPQARLWAPPDLAAKRPDLAFTDALDDTPPPDWEGQIEQIIVRGNALTKEVVFYHRASQTVLFVDLLQQFPSGWFSGWRAVVARLDSMVGPLPSVPRKFRLAFTDRRAARESVRNILAWPCQNVIMAHGSPVTDKGAHFLARAFSWLL